MDKNNINKIITGTQEIIHLGELEKLLENPSKVRVYLGIDPTSSKIHLGHTVVLHKLKLFQEMGAKVILLIGDFTAMIGDPSGRDTGRKQLSQDDIQENVKTYVGQAGKILAINDSKNPVEIAYNSSWHNTESKLALFEHLTQLTVQQFLERDLFQKRIKNNMPISLSEFMYPYLQGYDAVKLNADIQIGGNDQKFNMLVSRDLRRKMSNKNHVVITLPLLMGIDGRKMSKSYGNTINLDDKPQEIYGKIMSLNDEVVPSYFELLTGIDEEALKKIKNRMLREPKNVKQELALTIVSELYSQDEARSAEEEFNSIFVEKQIPQDIKEYDAPNGENIISILCKAKLCESSSQAQRLIEQGGVKFDNVKIKDRNFVIDRSAILQVGKRKFTKINIKG